MFQRHTSLMLHLCCLRVRTSLPFILMHYARLRAQNFVWNGRDGDMTLANMRQHL